MPPSVDLMSFGPGSWSPTSIGCSISSGADLDAVSELLGIRNKERDLTSADNGNDRRLHRAACAEG